MSNEKRSSALYLPGGQFVAHPPGDNLYSVNIRIDQDSWDSGGYDYQRHAIEELRTSLMHGVAVRHMQRQDLMHCQVELRAEVYAMHRDAFAEMVEAEVARRVELRLRRHAHLRATP